MPYFVLFVLIECNPYLLFVSHLIQNYYTLICFLDKAVIALYCFVHSFGHCCTYCKVTKYFMLAQLYCLVFQKVVKGRFCCSKQHCFVFSLTLQWKAVFLGLCWSREEAWGMRNGGKVADWNQPVPPEVFTWIKCISVESVPFHCSCSLHRRMQQQYRHPVSGRRASLDLKCCFLFRCFKILFLFSTKIILL